MGVVTVFLASLLLRLSGVHALTVPRKQLFHATGECGPYTNFTDFSGRQLLNFSFDLPPNILYSAGSTTCCNTAISMARERSKNSTLPIGWSIQMTGVSKKHPGQTTLLCTIFDYGASKISDAKQSFAGMTPPLPPFPPPPPRCSSFKGESNCPSSRCFWYHDTCNPSPPIKCGDNTAGAPPDAPLCVHVHINTTKWGVVTYTGDQASYNETVFAKPPTSFEKDAWFSMRDGIKNAHNIEAFRYCTQYSVACKECTDTGGSTYLAVCISFNGAAYDLQREVNASRFSSVASWQNSPFIANVVINDLP